MRQRPHAWTLQLISAHYRRKVFAGMLLVSSTEIRNMEPILFYGVPSGCSFGAIVALEWLSQPYRLCRIEMPRQVKSDLYKRLNPVGETPTLLTSDRRSISETMAIFQHLAPSGVASQLSFAPGSADADRFNQVLAFLNTGFFSAFAPLWYAYEGSLSGPAKDALRSFGGHKVAKAHADLEAMLGQGEWLLGARRSFADAYFAGLARWTTYHDVIDRRDYPGLQGLFERLEQDPGVRFAQAIERGENPGTTSGFLGHVSLEEAVALLPADGS
jgi:glutathione S-transferase